MPSSDQSSELTSDIYRQEYTTRVVENWDDYIDWDRRREAENGFFQKLLHRHGVKRALDVACGTGYHTITLAQDGFDVTGADGSPNMVVKARENAERFRATDVPFHVVEWQSLTTVFPQNDFDAVLCLGNSFTHLFDEESRLQALREMHQLLREGGVLIIDQRNYDAMLDRGTGGKHQTYYLGDSVNVEQENLSEDDLTFRFEYNDGSVNHLTICPIRQQYVTDLLKSVGFEQVERYGDFNAVYDFYEPEFIVQVARK